MGLVLGNLNPPFKLFEDRSAYGPSGSELHNARMRALCVLVGLAAACASAWPCTIFVVARNGLVFAGANEDYTLGERFEKHWVRFVPAKEKGQLGYVGFGYNFSPIVDQAAVNEAGLFYDYNALAKLDRPNEGKPKGGILHLQKMIATCRTVKEAVAYLRQYDFPFMSAAQMVLGDATGASAILERHTVTWRTPGADFQIGTNFRTSATPKTEITCGRYKACDASLSRAQAVSVESVRAILERTAAKGGGALSWYTTLCDLKSGIVHLFRKADFKSVATLDVKAELKKGARTVDMDDLMKASAKPYRRL